MPAMREQVRRGACPRGGIIGYPSDRLYEEVAYIAFHFHWPPDAILDLEHSSRQRWVEEIGKINKKVQATPAAASRRDDDQWINLLQGPFPGL